jgi:REP element-mobilizing transposase RayT
MPQSLSNVLVHLIFSTKNREPLITTEIESDLHDWCGGILRDLKCPPLRVGGTADHIHILFRLSRTMAVSEVVQLLKVSGSKWIKQQGPAFHQFAWQDGYGAFSVSQSMAPDVIRYIERQKEHHRVRSFQDEFRDFLRKYEIEFDERYVWD